jgi:hypothetical protein
MACVVQRRNAYRILMENTEGMKPLYRMIILNESDRF